MKLFLYISLEIVCKNCRCFLLLCLAQEKGQFCISHILNIFLYLELLNKFLVGNHCPIFYEDYAIKCSQYFFLHSPTNTFKNNSKKVVTKWPYIPISTQVDPQGM